MSYRKRLKPRRTCRGLSAELRFESGCGHCLRAAVDALAVLPQLCAAAIPAAPWVRLRVGIGFTARSGARPGVAVVARAVVGPTVRREVIGVGLDHSRGCHRGFHLLSQKNPDFLYDTTVCILLQLSLKQTGDRLW